MTTAQQPQYREHLSEPWFTLISLGLKQVEGRLNKSRFRAMKVDDLVEWYNDDFEPRRILTRITCKTDYPSFQEYLTTETIDRCLPGMPSMQHGLSVYYKYYTREQEAEFGITTIALERV